MIRALEYLSAELRKAAYLSQRVEKYLLDKVNINIKKVKEGEHSTLVKVKVEPVGLKWFEPYECEVLVGNGSDIEVRDAIFDDLKSKIDEIVDKMLNECVINCICEECWLSCLHRVSTYNTQAK